MIKKQVIILLMTVLTVSTVAALHCITDEDCDTLPNSYCYVSGECAPCLNCSLYNREAGKKECVKEKKDCGPCKAGLHAETNLDGSLSTCIPVSTTTMKIEQTSQVEAKDDKKWENWMYIFIFIAFIILTFVVFHRKLCKFMQSCANRSMSSTMCPNTNEMELYSYETKPVIASAPPSYSSETQEGYNEEYINSERQRINDQLQQARLHKYPCYVLAPDSPIDNNNDGATDGVPDQEEEQTDNHPLIPDSEETQPSGWTPNQNTQQVSSRMDFNNILSDPTAQLNISQPDSGSHSSQDTPPSFSSAHGPGHASSSRPNINLQVNVNQVNQNFQINTVYASMQTNADDSCNNQPEEQSSTPMDVDSTSIEMPDSPS